MRINLAWKLSLSVLLLLLLVLVAVDIFTARNLRQSFLDSTQEQLQEISRIAESFPPDFSNLPELRNWANQLGQSGARVTIITANGIVLADSQHDAETMENHANRPEIRQALAQGSGTSVRHSATLGRDLVYLAVRHDQAGAAPFVLRFALPLLQVDNALRAMRKRLWIASLIILALASTIVLIVSRSLSSRIGSLKSFSQRIAAGDFRPMPAGGSNDELEDLTRSLNTTASQLDRNVRALTDERNRSAAILRSMIEGVAVADAGERIVFANQAFLEILGLADANVEGRTIVEVARLPGIVETARAAQAREETEQAEVDVGTARPRTFRVTASPVKVDAGGSVVVVLHDISELRRLERVRRDFVANVSHEFRTPLTAIQGFAETLLGGAVEDPQHNRRFLEIIRNHAANLARLTEDLLDLAKIEAGRLELERKPVAIEEIVEACLETTRMSAGVKRIQVDSVLPERLPRVSADSQRIEQVLQNVLDNAVHYTPSGGRIEIRASAEPAAKPREVVITVEDTGIGIPEAEQVRIFERFYRADSARSRDEGGTGLGLAISRHLVEAHGGRMWVESEVGRGSQFHISLPVAGG